MGILTSKLPELPENFPDRYFITYTKCFDNEYRYILTGVSDAFTGTVSYNGNVSSDITDNYVLIDNCWYSTFITDYSYYRSTSTSDIVYASYDMYTDTGDFFYPESKYSFNDVNIVGSTVTSSSINAVLRSEYIPVFLILASALVLLIGLRKAWNFLTGLIRGA